jgi:predicted transcriptional regulator
MSKFYNDLKDFIKNKINYIDRLKDLAEMIETVVHINNRIYER